MRWVLYLTSQAQGIFELLSWIWGSDSLTLKSHWELRDLRTRCLSFTEEPVVGYLTLKGAQSLLRSRGF